MLEEFRKAYPQDPCLDLLLIDYYYAQEGLSLSASESIDRLDEVRGRRSLSERDACQPERGCAAT